MSKYLIRLDDACPYMDEKKWLRIEAILDKYNICPIVGIIPNCKDKELKKYSMIDDFWKKYALKWEKKNWTIAMHGFEHLYCTNNDGINPIHKRSEFAGLSLSEQREKIRKGYNIFKSKNIVPKIFFAPSHTFDVNTLNALKLETKIEIVSDTIANDIYYKDEIYFIPQQSGSVRKLPLKLITFCYHPNTMIDNDFVILDNFLNKHKNKFYKFDDIKLKKRKFSIFDKVLKRLYFLKHNKNSLKKD